ncbi:MAG: glycosyltransferase family 2 protein [Lachnospiraceae bacterium]|nr:glycosyltransferase family 2 protein [Lachnospiraceae bacterium]
MANLTAIILTRNEEKYISDCIKSVSSVAKRIVVVDSFSEDKTVEIAEGLGAEVYRHEFFNYAKQYMYAVEIADVKTTWILRIDADERLTKESAEELEELCNQNETTDVSGIILRFYNVFLGRNLKHGGVYPWRKLSVYKAGKGTIEDRNMDEHIILSSGSVIKAKKDCEHQAFKSLTFFVNKFNWYSTREAMDYFEQLKVDSRNADIKTRIKMNIYYKLPMGLRSWIFYVYRYYFRGGFLDGREGKIYAFLHAYWYRFLIDAKIYEHEKLGDEFGPTGALK